MDPPVARRATMVEPRVEPAGARTWARPDVVAAPTGELRQAPARMKFCGLFETPRSRGVILWLRHVIDVYYTTG